VLYIKQNRSHAVKPTRVIINWGSSDENINAANCKVYNLPNCVRLASNKLYTFRAFTNAGVSSPEWTTDQTIARDWAQSGTTVVCRTRLDAHSGDGIVFADNVTDVVPAPLYTKYIKKKKEFRVHVFNNRIIDIQEKRKSNNVPSVDFRIRNRLGGFVYCRDNITEPDDLRDVALSAISALGLDFGAVDVIWNEKQNKCYALEVNTAPGLEGTTLTSYVNIIKELAYG